MIADIFNQEYDRKNNNCLDFAAMAWERLTGDARLGLVREPEVLGARKIMHGFKRVSGPTRTPSIAIMDTSGGEIHIGVCIRKRLLHLCERGVEYLPFECYAGAYFRARFYQ